MIFTSERVNDSVNTRQAMLDALRIKPMTLSELMKEFNLTKIKAVGFTQSLRRLKLIAADQTETKQSRISYLYKAISDKNLIDVLSESKRAQISKSREKMMQIEAERNAFQKHPQGRIIEFDKYNIHSVGNKTKTNAWSGYTSF